MRDQGSLLTSYVHACVSAFAQASMPADAKAGAMAVAEPSPVDKNEEPLEEKEKDIKMMPTISYCDLSKHDVAEQAESSGTAEVRRAPMLSTLSGPHRNMSSRVRRVHAHAHAHAAHVHVRVHAHMYLCLHVCNMCLRVHVHAHVMYVPMGMHTSSYVCMYSRLYLGLPAIILCRSLSRLLSRSPLDAACLHPCTGEGHAVGHGRCFAGVDHQLLLFRHDGAGGGRA